MRLSPSFRPQDYQLPEIRSETWLGWIYVTLDPSLPPVAEHLAPAALVGSYGMEHYVETFREEHVWNTNWTILAESFMESYHLPMPHKATMGPHSRVEEMECPPGENAFNYHWVAKEATLPIGNAPAANTRLQGEWRKQTALLDEVNAEDRRGVKAVFRGVQAPLARPGHLSYLERPNYDFARYLARRVATRDTEFRVSG